MNYKILLTNKAYSIKNHTFFKYFLAVILLSIYTFSISASQANFIVIIADDLNDSIQGLGGHPQAKTPNLDRLMKQGVSFKNAACSVPLCGPSRASLWSGLSPVTTGYYGYNQQVNHWNKNLVLKKATTVFQYFVNHGYQNFSTGKIHHNGHEIKSIFKNEDGSPGFGTEGNFGPLPWDGSKNVLPPWLPENVVKKGGWGDGFGPIQDLKKLNTNYEWKYFYKNKKWQFRDGHNRDLMPDEICTNEAVQFINKSNNKPFLLTLGLTKPHSPWYAPQKYFDLFPLDSIKTSIIKAGDAKDCSKILVKQKDIAQPWGWKKNSIVVENGGEMQLKKWTQAYLACVAFMDDQVGKVLDALENHPNADNTYIIFTSDHGYHMGEKDYLFKFSPWEESARVPLIISGPGIPSSKTCTKPVSLLDIFPTIVDLAKLPKVKWDQRSKTLDGFSFKNLLQNPQNGKWNGPDYTVTAIASKFPVDVNQPGMAKDQHFSIRTEQFRYIRCRNGEEELYDHLKDPHEWYNKVNAPEMKPTLIKMRKRLSHATGLTL